MIEHINKFYALYGETIAKEGIAPIPTALFRYQKELGLSFQELALVCHLLSYRWTASNPHPSIETLSKITGISARTIHQYKNSLIQNGNLEVKNRFSPVGGQLTNEYDLTPLFEKLQILIEKDAQPQELPSPDDGYVNSTYPPMKAKEGDVNFAHPPMKNLHTPYEDSAHPPVKGVKNLQGEGEKSTHPPVKNLHTPYEEGFIGGVNTGSHEVNNIQVNKYASAARTVGTGGDIVTLSNTLETNVDSVTDNSLDDSSVPDDILRTSLEESTLRHTERFLDNKGVPNLSEGTAEATETGVADIRTETANMSEEEKAPTNRDLIAELTRKLHAIPGVEKLKGHYPMVGKAYNQYGYQAVAEAIEDLELEITGMRDLGMFEGTVPEKELTRMFFARCKWNYKPPQEGEKPRAGPRKQMTRELALAMGCIHDPENNRIIVTPEALENLRRARAASTTPGTRPGACGSRLQVSG